MHFIQVVSLISAHVVKVYKLQKNELRMAREGLIGLYLVWNWWFQIGFTVKLNFMEIFEICWKANDFCRKEHPFMKRTCEPNLFLDFHTDLISDEKLRKNFFSVLNKYFSGIILRNYSEEIQIYPDKTTFYMKNQNGSFSENSKW